MKRRAAARPLFFCCRCARWARRIGGKTAPRSTSAATGRMGIACRCARWARRLGQEPPRAQRARLQGGWGLPVDAPGGRVGSEGKQPRAQRARRQARTGSVVDAPGGRVGSEGKQPRAQRARLQGASTITGVNRNPQNPARAKSPRISPGPPGPDCREHRSTFLHKIRPIAADDQRIHAARPVVEVPLLRKSLWPSIPSICP